LEGKQNLPAGWKWVKLGEVCNYSQYGLTVSELHSNDGYPLIRITDIDNLGNLKLKDTKCTQLDETIFKRYELKDGDILFTRTGSLGRTFLYSGNPSKAVFASYLIRFSLNKSFIEPLYLFYYTHSKEYFEFIEEKKHTVSQPNINAEEYKSLLIPLPPLSEQKRIATKLKEMMNEVDDARLACEKQLEAAKLLLSAYLREVFESNEANKWERKRLCETLEKIESGSRPKGGVFEIKDGIPSIGAEHLNSFGRFNFDNLRFVPEEFYKSMTRGKIQKSDVLVVKDGATTGKVSFVRNDFPYPYAAINEHVFRLRGKEFLNQEFLFWFLYSPLGQKQIWREFHGAAQGGINQQFVNEVQIPLPSLEVQHSIVSDLRGKMAHIEKLYTEIEKQLDTINALPQTILRKAFRGEI